MAKRNRECQGASRKGNDAFGKSVEGNVSRVDLRGMLFLPFHFQMTRARPNETKLSHGSDWRKRQQVKLL